MTEREIVITWLPFDSTHVRMTQIREGGHDETRVPVLDLIRVLPKLYENL